MLKKIYSIALGLAFAFAAITLSLTAINTRHWQHAEQSWLEVNAKIEASDLRSTTSRRMGTRWSALWTYSYLVEGKRYQASSIALDGAYSANWYKLPTEAEADRAKRPTGSWTRAYYDPEDPSHSVLDPRTPDLTDTLVLLMALTTAFAALVLLGLPVVYWIRNR